MAGNIGYVTFCLAEPEEPFICYVKGNFTVSDLGEIEEIFVENLLEFMSETNEELLVTYSCSWDKGQYGEYGRCELPPGWVLEVKDIVLGGI